MDGDCSDLPDTHSASTTRRGLTRLLGGLTLAAPLAAHPLSVVAGKGRKRRRRKRRKKSTTPTSPSPPVPVRTTISQTFTNASPITIPAGAPATTIGKASPYPSVINVAGFANGRILDVNVTLHGFSHTQPNDVNVLLVAFNLPGNDALVMGGVGGNTDAVSLTLTLDDQAAAPLPTPIVGGTFKPTNNTPGDPFPDPAPTPTGNVALSVFNNGNPNGTWQLWVADDFTNDVGSIANGWSLQITAEVDA